MGAAMVDDQALILFAGGIGMEGTVVDNKVDSFLVRPTATQQEQQQQRQQRQRQQDHQQQGGSEAVVESDVLS